MSDNYIHIIPEQAGFVPEQAGREAALSYLRTIAPHADDLQVIVSRQLRFVDAGGNSGEIRCPACGKEMDLSRWQEWMNADFSKTGFRLRAHLMPCCGARYTLHELAYHWPEGFARCDLQAMNPKIGKLSSARTRHIEKLLGCAVRVIYQHI
jgi:hypothetical protein